MSKAYCKVGSVELSKSEAEEIYNKNLYICTSTAIYQPCYSSAQNQIYFIKISDMREISKCGKISKLTAEEINKILGFDYIYK